MDYIQKMRMQVGTQCLMLVAGNVIIYDEDDNYYLQQKPNGKLAFVGGFIEPSETIIEGTMREAKEEVDLDCDESKLELYAVYTKHLMEYPNEDQVKPHSFFFKYKLTNETIRAILPETAAIVKTKLSNQLEMINPQHQELLSDLVSARKAVVIK